MKKEAPVADALKVVKRRATKVADDVTAAVS